MILVTGGSGLLGSELINQLINKGNQVRALVNQTPLKNFSSEKVESFKADILDVVSLEDAMDGITEVYHCAGFVSYDPGMYKKLYKINVEGTANIVNAALFANVKKLIHVSSVAALDKNEEKLISEKMSFKEMNFESNYAKTKYLGELEVWRAMGEGLNAAIVNPSIILGNGDWNEGSSAIFKSVYNEFPWYTNGIAGFVDVRDVASAMIMLMQSEIGDERFLLSAVNESFKNIFSLIAKGFNKKLPHKKATPFLANVVWRLEWMRSKISGKKPLITKETARSAFKETYYDNDKFLKSFPEFRYTPLNDTITYCCNAMQQKLNKV